MDITSQEIMQLLLLALIGGSVGGAVGCLSLRTGAFSYATIVIAVLIYSVLMTATYFVGACVSPIPPQNAHLSRFEYALISTAFVGPGLCAYGSIPAILGNVVSQFTCRALKRRLG